MKVYNSTKRAGKEPKKAQSVEMNNFQDPQVRKSVLLVYYFFANMLGVAFI
jgi:hypothetical protein